MWPTFALCVSLPCPCFFLLMYVFYSSDFLKPWFLSIKPTICNEPYEKEEKKPNKAEQDIGLCMCLSCHFCCSDFTNVLHQQKQHRAVNQMKVEKKDQTTQSNESNKKEKKKRKDQITHSSEPNESGKKKRPNKQKQNKQ